MIYLIGGAPRIGKSIIGKELASRLQAQFVATDDLEKPKGTVSWPSFSGNPKENTTTPDERVSLQITIANALQPTIEQLIVKASGEKKDIVIEGIHLLPSHTIQYQKKYNAKIVFVGCGNIEKILKGMALNDNPNDWLKDASDAVRHQVAEFTVAFSKYVASEAYKLEVRYVERTEDFKGDIKRVIAALT